MNTYMMDESEGRTGQKYDGLPDFHLRNPLKPLIKEEINQSRLKKDRRLKLSLEALKREGHLWNVGNHYELWTQAADFDLGTGYDQVSVSLGDVIERFKLESDLSHIYNIEGMERSVHLIAEKIDVEKITIMHSFNEYLTILNALSSRRPVPKKYEPLKEGNSVRMKSRNGNLILITPELFGIIRRGQHREIRVFSSDWLRCASDVATERFLLEVGSIIGNHANCNHYPDTELINLIENWGDEVLEERGNNGYKILKTYEALCMGHMMASSDDMMIDSSAFWKNTVRDLVAEDRASSKYISKLKNILEEKVRSVHWYSQIYGLHRIWGHPLVDNIKGMEKVILIGQKNITLSDKMPKLAGDHFKSMLMASFLRKYNRYPALDMEECDEEFKQLVYRNDPSALDVSKGLIHNLKKITFKKNFQLPETFNLSMIVADKSVSPTKSELVKNIAQKSSVMNSELRRGVLRWLNDESIDPRSFLEEVNAGRFPEDHKIIGLTPKERELNPTPRMFALMSHLMRVYVVITESLLSEHILPLFPQITMTDNLLELNKKIYRNAKHQKRNEQSSKKIGKRTVCMSLDFEKWNGHMRKESTFFVFQQLGLLYGLENLYNETYDIFSNSYIYLADGSYIPKVIQGELQIENPRSFSNHKGGMEGLRQKGWTLFTIVCLDMICRRHHCTFSSMGMGDNQILMITFYTYKVNSAGRVSDSGLIEMKKNYAALFRDLMDVFGELGLPLKPLETWVSESLFLYGKYPVWKGIPLTMDLKRIMRIFAFSNIDIMTVENMLNTVAGSATAATQSEPSVYVSYIVGLLMLSMTIRSLLHYHPLTGVGLLTSLIGTKRRNLPDIIPSWILKTGSGVRVKHHLEDRVSIPELVMLMMTVPRSLGGYVTFNLPTISVRGFPDPLSRDLFYMQVIFDNTLLDAGSRELYKNWSSVILMPDINYKMLMEDILSINHLNPVTPMSSVRQSVSQYLSAPARVKNQEFLELVKMSNLDSKEKLAEILCSGDSLHIRLLHDIYDSTIPGYVDSIISKVTRTGTIQKIAVKSSKHDVSEAVMRSELNYFVFFNWRSTQRGIEWVSSCPTAYAKMIRRIGWNKTLKGVTVPFPLSYMSPTNCFVKSMACRCSDGYVSAHVSDMACNQEDWDYEIGNALPYMGSMTKEKVLVQSGIKVYSSEPLVRRPVKLMRTINWFVPEESEASKVITACVQAVTNIDVEQFKGVKEGTSGAESHRYHDSSMSHGSLTSSNYLYSTRYHISTDNFFRYAKGGVNFDIHYQSMLCLISEYINQKAFVLSSSGLNVERCYHWSQTCYTCVNPVDEDFTDIKLKGGVSYIPHKKSNKYLYVDEANLSFISETRPYESMVYTYMKESDYVLMSSREKTEWLTDTFSDKIVSQMFGGGSEINDSSQVDFHTGDVFNRVAYTKIDPVSLIDSVCTSFYLMCEGSLLRKNDHSLPTKQAIIEKAQQMLTEIPSGSLLGLAIMYSWGDVRERLEERYPNFLDEDPPSLSGACEAMRRILFKRLRRMQNAGTRATYCLVDELKDLGVAYKLIALQRMRNLEAYCLHCYIAVSGSSIGEFCHVIMDKKCTLGHTPYERYQLKTMMTYVSVDRLRKDCEGCTPVKAVRIMTHNMIKRLKYSSVAAIIDSQSIRRRLVNWTSRDIEKVATQLPEYRAEEVDYCSSDLMKTVTYPTSSLYKYLDLLSWVVKRNSIQGHVFLLGDGSGGTSFLISSMFFDVEVTVSTLLDSDNVIPQTMPHLFEHHKYALIDKKTMNNKVNNILHPHWDRDWRPVTENTQIVISDIEIMGLDREAERQIAFEKILAISSWKLAIIKDYLFNAGSLVRRLSIILSHCRSYELVTVATKQRRQPEVWWVLRNTSPIMYNKGVAGCYYYEVISNIWYRHMECQITDLDPMGVVALEIDRLSLNVDRYERMIDRAKMYCSVQSMGILVPLGDNYTRVLGKMQAGSRPYSVALSRADKGKRLFKSQEDKLREILLILSCSMIAPLQGRLAFINSNRKWALKWEHKKNSNTWMPYLKRMHSDQSKFNISDDFVGVLNRYMHERKLLFNNLSDKIEFDYRNKKNKKKNELHFPVAKNMTLRLNAKAAKTRNGRDKK
ncbi:TPA_asm: RNA-dependent RNA polymerase [Bacopa monnieri virus 1]|uniref:Replicase n=1 Tax=Bacopa monnieri virus 1 TaxID=2813287 RepID=A0AAD2QFQ9_9RHAB|nr:RNA-dependent RNA polymerase [Bacopa monnieri virus 1]DAF42448.1 TPA_asm: RNA-dependent RNA polymerase [Bacopa monnieri virus 1]